MDALNCNRLEAFFGRSPTTPWLDLLRNTRVTFRDEDSVDHPTVAGLLAFGTEGAGLKLSPPSALGSTYAGARHVVWLHVRPFSDTLLTKCHVDARNFL